LFFENGGRKNVKKLTCPGILLERILPGLGKGTIVAEMAVQGIDVADVSKNHRVLQTSKSVRRYLRAGIGESEAKFLGVTAEY
jgi:hypothetical protein